MGEAVGAFRVSVEQRPATNVKLLEVSYWREATHEFVQFGPAQGTAAPLLQVLRNGSANGPQGWAGEIPLKLSLSIDPAFVPIFDWTKMQYSVLIEEIDLVYL